MRAIRDYLPSLDRKIEIELFSATRKSRRMRAAVSTGFFAVLSPRVRARADDFGATISGITTFFPAPLL